MIRCQELVPDYYIEHSRDFQVLCRLTDYTFNALKYNMDTMQYITDTEHAKNTVLPLIGDKFGIYDKQSYSNREVLTALPSAVQYKGSLKSVLILLNAYLDSLNIFDFAIAYHATDRKSAEEISSFLGREISPYTIVVILSTAPSLVDLHVLDEYFRMVVPCGMIIEYAFGVSETLLDKFKYNENVFLFYIKDHMTSRLAKRPGEFYADYEITEDTPEFVKKVVSSIDLPAVGVSTVAPRTEE